MVRTANSIESIPLTAFDIDTTARVTGLSVSNLQRWDRIGFFHPSLADPNRRRPGSRLYSRNDLKVLRTVARLREAGVPLAQIKPVLPLLALDHENGSWPSGAFHVIGRRIYRSPDDAPEADKGAARKRTTTIDMAAVAGEVEEAIRRLPERLPEEIGQVVRRRGIMRGVPIIAGTRIPTETIAWFHGHGYSLTEIIENFPRLTPRDVEAAIAFED
jgi:DNA-binding transcriptional MerR regulator